MLRSDREGLISVERNQQHLITAVSVASSSLPTAGYCRPQFDADDCISCIDAFYRKLGNFHNGILVTEIEKIVDEKSVRHDHSELRSI